MPVENGLSHVPRNLCGTDRSRPQFEHLDYLSPATRGRLLARSGFRVLGTATSGKMVTLRCLGERTRGVSPVVGRGLTATLGRLPGATRRCALPFGQVVIFAERR
jgi:hypothetical protein